MKKIISILLAALLLFSFASCGKEEEYTTQTENSTITNQEELSENYDLGIEDVFFNNSKIRAGYPTEFKIKLENQGNAPISNFNIGLYDEFDNTLSTISYKDEAIKPGNTEEIITTIAMPSDFTPRNGYFKVTLNKHFDINEENNIFNIRLSYEDISIENVDVTKGENNQIQILGTVVNRGYGTSSKLIIELRENNEEGALVDTITIDTPLKADDALTFQFVFEDTNNTSYCVMLSKESATGGNMNEWNDIVYTNTK